MINNAVYAGALGAMMVMRRLDVLANNLANAATPGFKADRPGITANVAHVSRESFDKFRRQLKSIDGFFRTRTQFTQGPVQATGRELDLAIQGDGFFELQGPDGKRFYTRSGAFHLDAQGNLVTGDGLLVMGESGPIQVEGRKLAVAADGAVLLDGEQVDRLKVVTFEDPHALVKRAGTVFVGEPEAARPARDFQILQGSLEMSNVNPVRMMAELIELQRTFDADMRTILLGNQMNEKATANLGKLK